MLWQKKQKTTTKNQCLSDEITELQISAMRDDLLFPGIDDFVTNTGDGVGTGATAAAPGSV